MAKHSNTKAPVETDEQKRNRETVESIASNLIKLSKAVSALLNGPLKKKALVVLLANSSRLSQVQVETVLLAVENLEFDWLNR